MPAASHNAFTSCAIALCDTSGIDGFNRNRLAINMKCLWHPNLTTLKFYPKNIVKQSFLSNFKYMV